TGAIVPTFTATFCALTGLRQIAMARYAFGICGAKIYGLVNIVVNLGFGTIARIIAGQLISAITDGKVAIGVGIIVLCVAAYIISFFGLHVIHLHEQVA
ncbi:uncharacterized protein A1O9_05298, partial [Exophiala aquamarina CBS 119918]